MKLTPNEKERIHHKALLLYIRNEKATYMEGVIYSLLRSHAFYSVKMKKRNLSTLRIKHLVEEFGFPRRRIERTLKNLERSKLVRPHYFTHSKIGKDDLEYKTLRAIEKAVGRRNIAYVKYKILKVPGEKEMLKHELKRKKHKQSPT